VNALVSAVSALEVTTKYRIGKLPGAGPLASRFEATVSEQGFGALPITLGHAELAGRLSIAHRDPFDRLLIAQSPLEAIPLVSNERLFEQSGIVRIWEG
jgi:PIN domain nuclease of toxin-antitoxin system